MTDNNKYDIVSEEEISEGECTDAYFLRTEETIEHMGENPTVRAIVTQNQFSNGNYNIFTGVKDSANLLENTNVTVKSLPSGSFFDGGPVMILEGDYLDFARYETALLGFLSHHSGVANNAFEVRKSAPSKVVVSFGARHVHPSIGVVIERNSMIAGLDGFSLVAAENYIENFSASGTMPHALMLSVGEENKLKAWNSFNEVVGDREDTNVIILSDTFTDETVESLQAAELLGEDLDGVRLDTTGSRRGKFDHIIKEVKHKLEEKGHEDVDIFISGGLGPEEMKELRKHVDGFGIGGYISTADPLDFSLDIIQRKTDTGWETFSKRGKIPNMEPNSPNSMNKIIDNGEIVTEFGNVEDINNRVEKTYRKI